MSHAVLVDMFVSALGFFLGLWYYQFYRDRRLKGGE